MKRLLAIFLTLVMPLCFLLAVAASGAAADSILPVLQTPKPEAIEAPAFHALTGRKAPEAEKTESGALRYTYADVSYSEYLDFGRLLAQEGFTLVKSGENAAGAVTAVTGKDHAQLEVTFNQDERFLSVTYTAWTRPAETDAANPAVIDPAAVSALPELIQAISFEAVTAVMPGETKWGGTSYHHAYSGVSYAAYTRFGEKLGEEGYALASSEMLEGGVSRAVVEKDGVSLTLDYDMANQTASVLYPKGVHPRELSLYGDFTELLEGETVQLTESASLTWLGWEKVDSYKEYYKDYRYKPNPKRTSEEHTTGEGVQQVLLRFAVRLEAGEEAETADLIRNMTLYCDKDRLEMNRGLENGERSFNYDDLMVTITAGDTAKEYVVACGAALTDDQLQHPEEVAFTFNDGDNAVRYVCYFESPVDDETRRKDKDHARYGLALAGEILANAADATEAPESGLLAGHCESILKMDFLHPDKVIVIGLNDEQAKKAAAALDAQEYADIAPALAAQMNRDYPEYAAAADRTKAKYTEMETLPAALVLLPCGPHIAAVSFWGKQAGASLIISTAASSEALSAKDIRAYAKELGLSGLRISVYEGEKRDALLETGKLGSTPLHNLQRSAGATLNRLQKLFPHLTAKGVTTDLPLGALRVFLQKQETADLAAVRAGALSPVFFGSALTNFGVEPFLENFLRMTTAPLPRQTAEDEVDPFAPEFSAFVFKIQANMNKAHRDRIAFMRICSGTFKRDREYFHVQGGKMIKLAQPQQMMAQERAIINEAFAGDIIGVFDPGIFSIGDTVCDPKMKVRFEGIPTFAPEHFSVISQVDTMKRKQFTKGVTQIAQEGAIQMFHAPNSGMEEIIVGAVGVLQFEVLTFRLKNEYNVEVALDQLPYEHIRWIRNWHEIDPESIQGTSDMKRIRDLRGNPLLLFAHEWSVGMVKERNPKLILDEFGTN